MKDVELIRREEKVFDAENLKKDLNTQIANDILNRRYYYEPTPNGNANLLALPGLIISLFTKKNKKTEINYLSSEDLKKLFNEDRFFSEKLLSEELRINKQDQYLFFEYCAAKNIDSSLVTNSRDMELLELLLSYSSEFNQLFIENTSSNRNN